VLIANHAKNRLAEMSAQEWCAVKAVAALPKFGWKKSAAPIQRRLTGNHAKRMAALEKQLD